jgi:hypothetical protein
VTPTEISDTLRTAIRHLTSARRSLCAAAGPDRRVKDLREAYRHVIQAAQLATDARIEVAQQIRLIGEKAIRKGIFGKKARSRI